MPSDTSRHRGPPRALLRALPARGQKAPLRSGLPPGAAVRPVVALARRARRTTAGRLAKKASQRAGPGFGQSNPAEAWTRVRYQVSCWGVATWPPCQLARQPPMRWWPWRLQTTAAESGSSEPTGPPRTPPLSPRGGAAASPYSGPANPPASSSLFRCFAKRARR